MKDRPWSCRKSSVVVVHPELWICQNTWVVPKRTIKIRIADSFEEYHDLNDAWIGVYLDECGKWPVAILPLETTSFYMISDTMRSISKQASRGVPLLSKSKDGK